MADLQAWVAEAQECAANKDFMGAVAAYDKVIKENDEIAEVHMMKGVALSFANKDEEALDAFKRTIELKPDLAGAYANAGNIQKRMGKHHRAVKYFRKAVKLDSQIANAWGNLCHCLNAEGECEEALEMANKALRKVKTYTRQIHNERIFSCFKLGRPDDCLDDVETILENEPLETLKPESRALYCLILSQKGSRLLGSGDPENALPYLERSSEGDPTSGNLFPYGVCLVQLGREEEAIPILKKALELDPTNWRIMVSLGTVYLKQGNFKDAARMFGKALTFDEPGQDPNVHFNYAVSLINDGKAADAEESLRFVVDKEPDNYVALGLLGTLFLEQKKYDDAIDMFERAIKHPNAADDSPMHYNLGYAKLMSNKQDEALESFKNAVKIDPNNEMAQSAVKQLSSAEKEMSKKAIEEAAALAAGKDHGKVYREIMKRAMDSRSILERIQALLASSQQSSFRPRRPSLEAIQAGFVGAASTVYDEVTLENLQD